MVVDDFDTIRAGGSPDEAETELVVDADAVLACAITPQGLQSVAWGNAQVVQTDRDLQLPELAEGHAQRTGTGARKAQRWVNRLEIVE